MMPESVLLLLALATYLAAGILFYRDCENRLNRFVLLLAVGLHLLALVVRSWIAQHPPFTNMYETFVLLPFLIALRLLLWRRQVSTKYIWLVILFVVILLGIALLLPPSMKEPRPLMPALNSLWMYIHVPAYFFGYMAMSLAFLYALIIVFKARGKNDEELVRRMDTEVRIAFFFLNLGLVTGAIWAYISWGNYWGWDPKETWALINILILAYYFHLRKTTIRRRAIVIILSFLSIIFTYWGVSFILAGLHSYT